MSARNRREGIQPPHLADPPNVPERRKLVEEMYRERRPIPSPPKGVTSDDLIAARIKPSGPFWGIFDSDAHQNADGSNPYIKHGSLLVPRVHEAEFEQAERYLSKDEEAMGVLYELENDSREHVMRIGDDVRDDEGQGNIAWNPHLGCMDEHGHRISPALSLLHEEAHAIENPAIEALLSDVSTNDEWHDLEEERVITGVENRAARILHEGIRDSHRSADDDRSLNQRGDYWVDSVTSLQPSDGKGPLPPFGPNYAPTDNQVARPVRPRLDGGR